MSLVAAATLFALTAGHHVVAGEGSGGTSSADFDVLIYDATSGGVTAAVAAARSGVSHVGILCASWPACFDEGGRIIGGMTANGLGQSDIGGHDVFGGIAREFYERNWKHYFPDTMPPSGSEVGDMQSCRLPDAEKCNVTSNVEPHVGTQRWLVCVSSALCNAADGGIVGDNMHLQGNKYLKIYLPKWVWRLCSMLCCRTWT